MPTPSEARAIQTYQEFLAVLRRNASPTAAHWIQQYLQQTPSGELFQQLDLLQGWLASFRPIPAAIVAELDKLYDVRFTYHSNAIEGNTLTQSETEMVLEKGITVGGKSLREHLEAVGHREAIHYIRELAASDAALNERVIRDLHSLIMRAIEPEEAGRYRTLDVRAAGTEHQYPAHYHVPELMQEFAAWLASSQGTLHPVLYATQAHYRFVAIHPFRDGNGRTGRLLMNLLLLQQGYPIAVLTSERRAAYIDSLVFAQTHQDDTEPLTKLVAAACLESLVETLSVLATAAESQGKGLPFYEEMLRFAQSD